MENLFISYELAKLSKDKGFDETCCAYYNDEDKRFYIINRNSNTPHNNKIFTNLIAAPTYQQLVEWLDNKGYYLQITPEFYKDGINWNWQIWWYLPKDKQIQEDYYDTTDYFTGEPERRYYDNKTKFMEGTYMYGDNHEYPTRIEAIKDAIKHALTEIL